MFRFSIRDVLWLTVVVAVCTGWWLERHAAAKRQAESEAQIRKLKSEVALRQRATELFKAGLFKAGDGTSNLLHHLPDPDGL